MRNKVKIIRVKDNSIDISRIKTIKWSKFYSGDKEKKKIEIFYNDRVEFIFNPTIGEKVETAINDKIEIVFSNEKIASEALELIEEEWQNYSS